MILVLIILIMISIVYFGREDYVIKVKTIDSFSPERTLEVYKNNKKIDYREIQYQDGVILCYSSNPTVAYTDLLDNEVLIIVLKDYKKVKAKIVEN